MTMNYKIGDTVLVRARAVPDDEIVTPYYTFKRTYHRYGCTPFVAKVVGYSYRQLGTTRRTEDGPEFKSTGTILVLLVRRGICNKAIPVFETDVERTPDAEIPWKWTNPCPLTEADRQWLREDSKNYPRDHKGRFTKERKAIL